LISSQNDYKCLLEKFETFANLNCELSTKIEQLESSAPSTATDDGLIKKNEKLKAKLASSQEIIENLLGKMEILSIHNNELTTKLENIDSTPGASLVEIPEIIKKDASTSCFDLIDNYNPCTLLLAFIQMFVIFACFGCVVINHQKGGDCKENGPRVIWLNRFWCLLINITYRLMCLLVFMIIVHRMPK
jgi:FtsZ-binding cell division protein ZapB